MPGIIEELFIAGTGGSKQVYFRNWSVCASLNIRSLLNADPESVAWGPSKDKFCVRTGTTPATQRYYLFHIVRDAERIFAEGVIPTAILDATHLPFQSTLGLITISATYESRAPGTRRLFGTNRLYVKSVVPAVGIHIVVSGLPTPAGPNHTDVDGSGSSTKTLATILTTADRVDYALNQAGELLLLVIGAAPGVSISDAAKSDVTYNLDNCVSTLNTTNTTVTVSVGPRAEKHLWLVNYTLGSVLFRTAKASPSISTAIRAANVIEDVSPTGRTDGSRDLTGSCGGGVTPFTCETLPLTGAFEGIATVFAVAELVERGTKTLLDSILDTTLPFVVTPVAYTTASTDAPGATLHTLIEAEGTVEPGGSCGATELGDAGTVMDSHTSLDWTKTVRTWATNNNPWTYSVTYAFIANSVTPVQLVLIVKRVNNSATHYGLFTMKADGGGYKALSAFTTGEIKVLAVNSRHVLWARSTTAKLTVYNVGINGTTKDVGTLTQGSAGYYRLLAGDELYKALDVSNAAPAGVILDAWEGNGNPTLDLSNLQPLEAFGDLGLLQIVPASVATVPVIPSEP